MASARKI